MNRLTIQVKVKDADEMIDIILYQKIYSTPEGFINYWLSGSNFNYRLEVVVKGDQTIRPENINKDLKIVSTDIEIADQVMTKLYEQRIIQLQNY